MYRSDEDFFNLSQFGSDQLTHSIYFLKLYPTHLIIFSYIFCDLTLIKVY
jgi:hypothetical protein